MASSSGTSEIEEDPTIGELKMYLKTWSNKEIVEFKELETKACNSSEDDDLDVNFKDEDSKFFPTREE